MYEPLSGVCLSLDVSLTLNGTFAIFAILGIFDVTIIILTALKVFRLASAMRNLSGSEIVQHFPFFILCVLLITILGSSAPCSGME